ncbi:unnamed protein product [Periconia digitata]|uniref:Uncharacterized protein n=1 Tax=Periconia digitata TaxID=1303443 RepID=A0A9W4XV63_9PLEO|nr:unnamed protein product [Periconia digitata]
MGFPMRRSVYSLNSCSNGAFPSIRLFISMAVASSSTWVRSSLVSVDCRESKSLENFSKRSM